jgi:tellurite resistance protein TerC
MTIVLWVAFIALILLLLALDLGVFHKTAHVIGSREALLWTLFWIALALLFCIFIYHAYRAHWFGIGNESDHVTGGSDAALKYVTGYIVEKSLSLDNIFVIAVIFAYFKVPLIHQHRVLFWGILGALVMRGVMIAAGAALIEKFSWMIYVFGILLVVTALRMLFTRNEQMEPEKNVLLRLARRIYPVTKTFQDAKFFTRLHNRRAITPLFLVLLVIESTDVLFAIDSIPAIFAITTDPFIVFTSNVFAILGLRSLYFAIAAMMSRFRYIKVSLVFVLAYVGVKMILSHHYPIPTTISLGVIVGAIATGILTSLFIPDRSAPEGVPPPKERDRG